MRLVVFLACISLFSIAGIAQNQFEKHNIGQIEINFGETQPNTQLVEQYRLIANVAIGTVYSTARVRDAVEALYDTKKIDTILVSATLDAAGNVNLRFDVKRKVQADKVDVIVGATDGDKVTEQELLFRLNLLAPGATITEQTLRNNADEMLDYLRDRGFYRSEVVYERKPLLNQNNVGVTFRVTPGAQAKVAAFKINIQGLAKPITGLKLETSEAYSRDRLTADVDTIRASLRADKFFAPELDEPLVTYDSEANTILIVINGKVGPLVDVKVDADHQGIGNRTLNTLLPIKREGTLDFAAVVEGARRLEDYYQEHGYFFAAAKVYCSVTPTLNDNENNPIANDTEFLCQYMGGEDLMGRKVEVRYNVALDRRLKLTELRLKGTNELTMADVQEVLGSKEASVLGIVPILGYGRGYTSEKILEDDENTIRSLMVELGYRNAQVHAHRGVSPTGDNLIITFVVDQGVPTVITDVAITGNKAINTQDLSALLPVLKDQNYSRAKVRAAARKLSQYYSDQGYYDARVTPSLIEGPAGVKADRQEVKVEFKVENEGKKVVINRLLVTGNEATKSAAVIKALTLKSGEYLKATDVYTSEQNLYGTDAFSRVDIKPEPAGDASAETRLSDVIVNVEEQPARLLSYGGGYSTDVGVNGFFDIRHVNLFGNLWQGGARVKVSRLQQLVQFDLINPRFIHDGPKKYAPLTFSLQYQKDTTVTRFFRSAFDRGTFGIVQRVDAKGNPIDEFGRSLRSPTINRLSLTAETNHTISRKDRSIVFLRYRFEDVRLSNIDSLLIKDLLRPDARTRISGFNVTFVRDTRQNCSVKYSLLELIAKGEPADRCKYNATDPTNGNYVTADYNVSLPALGANIGFHKFQASYNFYYTFATLKNSTLRSTTLAARAIIGFGQVFSGGNRFTNAQFPSLNGLLPISERFFAGGADTLRGFDLEEAGPRVAIVPQGTFRDSTGKQVFLDPFTVPFGGNALAEINLEARVPLTDVIRAVPFYDGGNVFRRAGDIFKRPNVPSNNVELWNQRAVWTHTVGLGFRLKTPIGGEFGVDYGRLLNPPTFLIPQGLGPNAIYRLHQNHIHFQFTQAF
jgi:outer membrane protein assembly complex protein YaeT